MKKDNVLQYAVAITGIIFGYQLLQSYLFIILSLVGWVVDGGRGNSEYLPGLLDILALLLKTLLCWLLIIKSGKIAAYIIDKGNVGTQLNINIRPAALLQILFISIGLYFFIASLPLLLNDLLDSLREKNGIEVLGRSNVVANRFFLLIQTVLAALAMGLSKPLSAFFAKQIDEAPISITQNIDNISTTDGADVQ
jgi:hypothetical protein